MTDRRYPGDARDRMRQERVAANPDMTNKMAGSTLEFLLSLLPGSGEAMSARDSVAQGQDAVNAVRSGDYGRAASSGLGALVAAAGAIPVAGALARAGTLGKRASDAAGGIRAYHGSPHDFDKFDMSKVDPGAGLWFSSDEGYASGMAGRANYSNRNKGTMFEVDLNVKNPFVVDAKMESSKLADDLEIDPSDVKALEEAWRGGRSYESLLYDLLPLVKSGGHDAVIFQNTIDGFHRPTDQYVLFNDNLIEILRKYGIPLALGAGVASAMIPGAAEAGQ